MSIGIVILIALIAIGSVITVAIAIGVFRIFNLFNRQGPQPIQQLPNPNTDITSSQKVVLHVYSHLSGSYSTVYSDEQTIPADSYTAKNLASTLNSAFGSFIRSTHYNDELQKAVGKSQQLARYEDVFEIYFPTDTRYYTLIVKRLSSNPASQYTLVFFLTPDILKGLGAKVNNANLGGFTANVDYPNTLAINIRMRQRIQKLRIDEI